MSSAGLQLGRTRFEASRIFAGLDDVAMMGHPECAAGAALGMGDLQSPAQSADEGMLNTPVELKGLAKREGQRNLGTALRVGGGGFLPPPNEDTDPVIADGVAFGANRPIAHFRGPPLPFEPVTVRVQPLPQLIRPKIVNAIDLFLGIRRLDPIDPPQRASHGVSR